uniref:Uncharacterized protein n=1 Tax=Rhizophora mucronata TaxID=61149 RepID=A0A2P2IHH2_RHIMU
MSNMKSILVYIDGYNWSIVICVGIYVRQIMLN